MSELPPPPLVLLITLPSRSEADGLRFTLQAVNIDASVSPADGPTNGHGPLWQVLVPTADLPRARHILSEEPLLPAATPHPTEANPAPPFTWIAALLLINILIWVAMEGQGGSMDRLVLLTFGASHAPSIFEGQWWRLITALFIHIGAKHLLANSGALLVLGPFTLGAWGVGRFYGMYLLSGVAGNIFSLAISPTPALKAGASGAILGLLGILAGTRIRHLQTDDRSRFKTWHVIAMVIAFYGFVVGVGPADHLAHIGGLLAGGLLSFIVPFPGHYSPRAEWILNLGLGGSAAIISALAGLLAYATA